MDGVKIDPKKIAEALKKIGRRLLQPKKEKQVLQPAWQPYRTNNRFR